MFRENYFGTNLLALQNRILKKQGGNESQSCNNISFNTTYLSRQGGGLLWNTVKRYNISFDT